MKKNLKAIYLLPLLIGLIPGWELWAQKTKIVDRVSIITNGKNPSPQNGIPSKIRWEEDFLIGGGDIPEESFALVSSFVVDGEGTIYALDTQDAKIKIFDGNGKYLNQFGQKGQGPGEFETPTNLHLSPEDELAVEDSSI